VLEDRVADTITRYAMFSPGHRVGVAVSGGADSVCLLHTLHELGSRWDLRLHVVHIDHGIRGAASEADAEFVRALAASFGLPFEFRRVDVPAIDDNLEQAARHVRQQFYLEMVRKGTVDLIATGHTRSDQAETVLFRILRGAALTGLSGIRPLTADGIVRPLLYCTRSDVRSWLEARNIPWREDETNQDRSYARNRLRHDLLPQLRRDYNPRLDEALANLAELARDEDDFVGQVVNLQPIVNRPAEGSYTLSLSDLPPHPAPARRQIRQIIASLKGDVRQIDFAHVEAILDMARSKNGHARVQVPGLDVTRSYDWLRFAIQGHDAARPTEFCVTVAPPQTVDLPCGNGQIVLELVETAGGAAFSQGCDSLLEELDWDRIVPLASPAGGKTAPLELRNWRPGDRYRPVGRRREQKIKLLFEAARIPEWERRGWPVVTFDAHIVWSRQFGAAAGFARDESTKTVLRIAHRVLT